MRKYIGMDLTAASPYVKAFKENYFEYREDEYKQLMEGMHLAECDVTKDTATLIYKGRRNELPLTITYTTRKGKSSKNGEILMVDASYDNTAHSTHIDVNHRVPVYENEDLCYRAMIDATMYSELLTWLDSAPKDFKDCKIRILDWKHQCPEEYKKFSDYVLKQPIHCEGIMLLQYKPQINHFIQWYHDVTYDMKIEIDDHGKPYIFAGFCGFPFDENDESKKNVDTDMEAMKAIFGDDAKIRQEYYWCGYRTGMDCYTIEEVEKMIETIRDYYYKQYDEIAAKHGFDWRSVEKYDHNGPIGVKSVDEHKREMEQKYVVVMEDYLCTHLYDYRKIFTKEYLKQASVHYSSFSATYERTFTLDRYKKGTWTPQKVSLLLEGSLSTRNYDEEIVEKDLDVYGKSIIVTFPFVYRTVEDSYYSFDEALAHNDSNGPIDVLWKKDKLNLEWLIDQKRRTHYDENIENGLLKFMFMDADNDELKAESKKYIAEHADYFDWIPNYISSILDVEGQYKKYVDYVKSL